jgi:hypothetical protein
LAPKPSIVFFLASLSENIQRAACDCRPLPASGLQKDQECVAEHNANEGQDDGRNQAPHS